MSDHATDLYYQVECGSTKNTINDCGEPIRMQLIPLESGDPNQDETTFIWRCNVTRHLAKKDLVQEAAASKHLHTAIRVQLYVKDKNDTINMQDVTQIDIPLHTGVAGFAGPQIRSSHQNYFSPPPQQDRPLQVGLCMSMYGRKAVQYLPDFVQHHKNVGIDQIVIAVKTTMDSDLINTVEELLQPYIDEGFVVLQAIALNSYYQCGDAEYEKLHSHHQCLYHFKGIAKYSATWDLDEFWVPPGRLEISGYNNFTHGHQGSEVYSESHSMNQTEEQRFIVQSDHSAFSHLVTSDPQWQNSNYSKLASIQDVMRAIEQFQIQHGCGEQWCYHLFPSYEARLKKRFLNERHIIRKNSIGEDFYKRDNDTMNAYQKGVAKTQIAMMGGIHVPGSCQCPNDPRFHKFARDPKCFPHLFVPEAYGSMHHFWSLIEDREGPDVMDKKYSLLPEDE